MACSGASSRYETNVCFSVGQSHPFSWCPPPPFPQSKFTTAGPDQIKLHYDNPLRSDVAQTPLTLLILEGFKP